MRNNFTHLTRYKTGKPRTSALKVNKKRLPSNISANYMLVLQIYYINKKENAAKKELKYKRTVRRSRSIMTKSPFSFYAAITGLFNINLSLLRKAKSGMAMASVTE